MWLRTVDGDLVNLTNVSSLAVQEEMSTGGGSFPKGTGRWVVLAIAQGITWTLARHGSEQAAREALDGFSRVDLGDVRELPTSDSSTSDEAGEREVRDPGHGGQYL